MATVETSSSGSPGPGRATAGSNTVEIFMPQLGETVTEGTITRWFKIPGEQVAEDEPLFEVSTDKVDTEVPSPASATVAEVLVAEGQTVDVGVRLAILRTGEPVSGKPASAPPTSAPPTSAPPAMNAAARGAAEGEGKRPSPVEAKPVGPGSGRLPGRLLSPLVRGLLSKHGVDPQDVTGTGQDGRITRDDVLGHVSDRETGRVRPEPAQARSPGSADRAPAVARDRRGDTVVRFSNIRRRTAEHMIRSQATAAHVLVAMEVDYANVDRVRLPARTRFAAEEGFSLTYLPFVVRAAVEAIAEFPQVNASVGDNELVVHGRVHMGIAVDLNFEGLLVPVIHDADSLGLRGVARSVADLATRARSRSLTADEIAGSTFTITNPGSYGTFITAPVINQPQVAIMSTDGVRKRPVVVEGPDGDAIAVHPVGLLALSFDHRAFDGAYASAFLARCRQILQERDWSTEVG
ncbi:MAG: dihydrolipoamide acetyltransferase family protein [Acidimicrobiales bacterium]